MSQLFGKPLETSLDPKSVIVLKHPSGKIINAEIVLLLNQIFDLGELGQSCIKYPITTSTDCGEEVTLPLQISTVLLTHEELLCQIIERLTQIETHIDIENNIPPTVNAGSNQTIQLPLNQVVLNAYASDPDGTIASYLWEQISGSEAVITDNSSNTTTVTGLQEGQNIFKITVTDNQGSVAVDIVIINVVAVSALQPPVANAGSDISFNLPVTTTSLNGNTSSDSDGTIVSYLWEQISGAVATIETPNNSVTSITGLNSEGAREFKLTVTDNDGLTSTDTVLVTVSAEEEVSVAIEVVLGDCSTEPHFASPIIVYLKKTQTEINTGSISIENGDIVYSNSLATILYDGGDNLYRIKNINDVIEDYSYQISSVGVISNKTECIPAPSIYNGILQVDNCADNSGQNTLIDATGSEIGDTITLDGTATPFNGGGNTFKFTSGGVTGFYSDASSLILSNFIIEVDATGTITSKTTC